MLKRNNNISFIMLWSQILYFGSTITQEYKIAFVKQVVYQDLYCAQKDAPYSDLIFSSFKRSGPVALFSKLHADFYIVDTETDRECNIWKEKTHGNTIPYELLRSEIPLNGLKAGHIFPQGHFAVKASHVDWGMYDIVIAMECAIPAKITKLYPSTLWAYYIGEGNCPSFAKSFRAPIPGYDCFLSQDFKAHPSYKSHVIEFPYQLQYYGCFHELLGIKPNDIERDGVFLESHSGLYHLNNTQKKHLNQIAQLKKYSPGASLKDLIQTLIQTKYFIIFMDNKSGKRMNIRGNSIPEAIAAGNLVIARNFGIKNLDLLTEKTIVRDFDELIRRLAYFEQNHSEYQKELEKQRKKLNLYCCERPIHEITSLCLSKKHQKPQV